MFLCQQGMCSTASRMNKAAVSFPQVLQSEGASDTHQSDCTFGHRGGDSHNQNRVSVASCVLKCFCRITSVFSVVFLMNK